MHRVVGGDDPGAYAGAFLVPRFPTDGEIAPTLGAFLREHFVQHISRTDGASLCIEHNRLFVIDKNYIGARWRSYLRRALIQGCRIR